MWTSKKHPGKKFEGNYSFYGEGCSFHLNATSGTKKIKFRSWQKAKEAGFRKIRSKAK
jgi:hypothetical protein